MAGFVGDSVVLALETEHWREEEGGEKAGLGPLANHGSDSTSFFAPLLFLSLLSH